VNFGVALFFTILVDEVCYIPYRDNYETFRQLTRYPKFSGNCLTMCRYHLLPAYIFVAMNLGQSGSSPNYLVFYYTFFKAIPIMEEETKVFFQKYLPTISGQEFWNKRVSEFPFRPIE